MVVQLPRKAALSFAISSVSYQVQCHTSSFASAQLWQQQEGPTYLMYRSQLMCPSPSFLLAKETRALHLAYLRWVMLDRRADRVDHEPGLVEGSPFPLSQWLLALPLLGASEMGPRNNISAVGSLAPLSLGHSPPGPTLVLPSVSDRGSRGKRDRERGKGRKEREKRRREERERRGG